MNIESATAYASLADTAAAIAARRLTSEALVEFELARIARLQPRLNAFVEVYADEAREVARALDALLRAGVRLGPLHGVTVAIKDLFDIEGRRTGAGSRARMPAPATRSATVVDRLRAAGAIVIGKTQTVEFAFGGWGTNAVMGTPWNPWDLATHRVPGGSSSGSAVAVAAGLCRAAIGTDTGGSVRIPAGLCGVAGLKTTLGLVSRHGLVALCPTHDSVGPITRTARDAALVLDAIAGADPLDAASAPSPPRQVAADIGRAVAGARVWVLPDAERDGVEPEVLRLYDQALGTLVELGMHLVERALPQSLDESMRIAGQLMSAEGYAHLGALFEHAAIADPHVRRRILAGREIDATRYIALLGLRDQARLAMHAAMDGVDALCMPSTAITAPAVVDVDEASTPLSRFGRFVNLLDLCACSVPAGLSDAGLPVAVQFIGRPFAEPLVLRLAHAFEAATPWHLQVPPDLD